jgi:hypothetical protein
MTNSLAPKNRLNGNGNGPSTFNPQPATCNTPPPIHESTNSSCRLVPPKSDEGGSPTEADPPIQPPKRSRNGKIARLPYTERDMVNRMLRNNVPHSKIRDALEEHGIRVTERNVSNWKTRGAYKQWCIEQDRALENRLTQDNLTEHLRKSDASQLPEVGLQIAATNLSQFFLKPQTQQQLATDPEKFARTVSMICRLSRHIHALQKYRDETSKELGYKYNPERIKRETEEEVELTRSIYSAAKLGESPAEPDTPHHNYLPKNWDTPAEPLD